MAGFTSWRTNAASFNRELQEYLDKQFEKEREKWIRALALEALRRIVLRTPVDTGRLRGAWLTTVDKTTEAAPPYTDATGRAALIQGAAALAKVRKAESIYIQNNVHYAGYVEDGTPQMQGYGMVATTLAELSVLFATQE